ncbi:MAG TPA: hypothetical protein VFK89_05650 [Actinomycetota bacterium]|nr:hypothetical protein [Actinomycetota bacterium]
MSDTDLKELETAIKQLPGILGCVILANGDAPSEIQAFTSTGTDRDEIQARILEEVASRDFGDASARVFVFELEAESYFDDLESLERQVEFAEQEARARGPIAGDIEGVPASTGATGTPGARGTRPRVRRVALTSSSWTSEATVALGQQDAEVVGQAVGEKTPHGLKVVADATLEAAGKIAGEAVRFHVKSASLVSIGGQEAVLVLVLENEQEMLGAALTRGGPLHEATVKATLDAINRRLALRT